LKQVLVMFMTLFCWFWRSSVYSATASSLQAYTRASDSKFDCLSIHHTSFFLNMSVV